MVAINPNQSTLSSKIKIYLYNQSSKLNLFAMIDAVFIGIKSSKINLTRKIYLSYLRLANLVINITKFTGIKTVY